MFALLISMPRFESINFYQKIPKIKLFLQKNAKTFVCWGLRPQTPKTFPHCEFLATRLVFLLLLCYFVQTDFAARWCLWFSASGSFFEQVCPPLVYSVKTRTNSFALLIRELPIDNNCNCKKQHSIVYNTLN